MKSAFAASELVAAMRIRTRLASSAPVTPGSRTRRWNFVRGTPRHLGEAEEHRAETLPLRPWVGTEKYDVVEIVPTEVTGRRFRLDRPWLSMRPSD